MKKIIVITVSFFLFIYLSVIAQEVKIKEKNSLKTAYLNLYFLILMYPLI